LPSIADILRRPLSECLRSLNWRSNRGEIDALRRQALGERIDPLIEHAVCWRIVSSPAARQAMLHLIPQAARSASRLLLGDRGAKLL